MAVGRISGPLLKDNLLRNGVNLAFETNLLYLDVVNSRVGINTATPTNDLSVNGTTRTTNLYASNSAILATFTISGSTVFSTNSTITFSPSGPGATIYQGTALVGNLSLTGNTLSSTNTNGDINITANGIGAINLNNNVLVTGNLHATGNITADGNITLGNASTDTVTFDAEINSDIIPSANNTYNLGSPSLNWANLYTAAISASALTTTDFTATGTVGVSGTSTLSGNTTIGATSANTLNVIASINSNLIPSATNTYSLGTSSLYWNNAYISTINTAGMQITGNSISTTGTNSNLQLTANGTGNVIVPNNTLQVTNAATIGGTLDVSGKSTLADVGITGTLTQTGDFTQSSGNFSTSGTINSGAITSTGTLTLPNLTIAGSTITGTSATNLVLTPYSGQQVEITSNATLDQNATVGGTLGVSGTSTLADVGITGTLTQTGDFTQTGNFTTSGNLIVTGNITASGAFTIDQITISGSTITTNTGSLDLYLAADGVGSVVVETLQFNGNQITATGTDANIYLTPQTTGSVVINNGSLIIPVGTTTQRPVGTNGMIRYNTTLSRYEGYSAGYWTNLGGVQSVDGNTYIIAESSPGAGNNVISFYANNVETAYIDSTKLYATAFQTNNLSISNNTISTLAADTNINFTTSGTGGVKIGNLLFVNNTVTNTSANAVTQFTSSGSGYVQFAGTYGVAIPVGTNSNRPVFPYVTAGMTRFNTEVGYVEVYNGTNWLSVAGSSGGVTSSTAQDIGIETALALG